MKIMILSLFILLTIPIFAQSGKGLLVMGDEKYQPLTITANAANYVIDNGTGSYYFQVAGVAGKSFKVDWGDGTTSQITFTGVTTDQRISKTYTNAGTYNVKIYGWDNVTRLYWKGWNAGAFNLQDLPTGLTYILFHSLGTNLIGSISSLPTGLTYVYFYAVGTKLTGNISLLPANLISLYLVSLGTNLTYTSPRIWLSMSDYIELRYLGLDQTEIDNILCDVANSNNLVGSRTLNLSDGAGNNAAPSATGVDCKSTLTTQGWTATTD